MKSASGSLGVTRNITEVFTLLRTNAQHNKYVYTNSAGTSKNRGRLREEKMSLVELEEGGSHTDDANQPLWIHTCDEVEFEFGKIRSRLEELGSAQQKHISRPNFGDESFEGEERRMEAITEQVTSMMSHCQRLINMMSSQLSVGENSSDRKLRENAVSALIFTLSNLTDEFRLRQNKYLSDVRKRSKAVDDYVVTTGADDMQWADLIPVTPSQEYTMDQIQAIMVNEQVAKEREKEVLVVNSSIRELNTLFKDLSSMVIDQGTILDRIDYNVEQSSIRVSKAVESVYKAERYQRGDKKMHCICCLAIAIIFVLLLIITTKL